VNVDNDIWSTLTKFVVGLIVLAVLLLIGMCYLPVIQENTRMRAQILKLDQQLETETNQLNQLQAQIDALSNDPKTIERLAREKLGYAKPDETVIRFEAPATNSPVKQ
jgi:cell division protein FtsB